MPLASDIRHATRRLARSPAFTLAAALTLALGIGGASAVFTVVNGVLLQPLPYPRSDRLVDLSHSLAVAGVIHVDQSDATYLLYRRDNRVFTDVGIYRSISVNMSARAREAGTSDEPRRVLATLATPSVLRVLDATPVRGRDLNDADAEPGAPSVAIVSQSLWESAFGSDPAIVGRHLLIDGADREIVGVLPTRFRLASEQTELWLPLALDQTRTNSAAFDYRGIARLRDGITVGAAAGDLQRLLPLVPVVYPGRLTAAAIAATKMRAEVQPLRDVVVGNVSRVLWIVLAAVGMLLLVACTNVANLFLARAEGRHREFAVRRALGAGRISLLHASLAEAVVLSAIGGALGIAMAAAGVGLLHRVPAGASIPRMGEVHIDVIVVAFAAVITIAVAFAVSILPAIHAGRDSLASLMGADGRTPTGTRFRHGVRRALVVSQVALALVLVSGATLFALSFQRLSAVNPGFEADHALAFRLNMPAAAYPMTGDAAGTVIAILRAVRTLPGVEEAGVATRLPLDGQPTADSAVFVEDHPLSPGQIPDIDPMVFATPDYFGAMGIPLLAGRMFAAPDPSMDPLHAPREVLVNDALARRYWTTTTAVGRRIRMNPNDPWSTIVGVVGSTLDGGLEKPAPAIVYNQLVTSAANGKPWTPRDVAFVIRVNGHATDMATSARSAVRSIAPALPVYRVLALRSLLADAAARTTFTVLLLGIAAVMALIIGTMGIYGVVTFLVALRTREIGLRLALGAQPGDVRWMIVRRALGDATIGVVVGLAGAVTLTRELSRLLFSVSPTDATSLALASGLLLLTAMAASWLPARRAARLDPAITLRDE